MGDVGAGMGPFDRPLVGSYSSSPLTLGLSLTAFELFSWLQSVSGNTYVRPRYDINDHPRSYVERQKGVTAIVQLPIYNEWIATAIVFKGPL